jgi:hypothetical protein
MATFPDFGPMWWDRDVDDQGRPIRADVRQAAHGLWPEAVRRVRRMIFDPGEAAELIERFVLYTSHHLDRANVPASAANVRSLLSLCFSQELRRVAKRLGRITLIGDNIVVEALAVVEDWAERVNRHLDFEKITGYLRPRTRTLVVMRLEHHSWELIGTKLGGSPATLRKAFWKDLREVLPRMEKRRRSEKRRVKEISLEVIDSKLPPPGLPPDAEAGEAEIINGFYRWVRRNHPNRRRIGCPGRIALAELVVADSKFDDCAVQVLQAQAHVHTQAYR